MEHLFGCTDAKRGRPRRSEREIVEAILWVEQNHYKWHWLPADYPPAQTCYTKYVAWRRDGLLDRIKSLLKDASLDARTYE
ncbi:transposase [Paraburkholderia sp. DHOC27]|nr:transposase [Paraburkholderia sp. DHOC27]